MDPKHARTTALLISILVMGCGSATQDGPTQSPTSDAGPPPFEVLFEVEGDDAPITPPPDAPSPPTSPCPPSLPGTTRDVTKFGAIADDGKDDTAAVRAALDASASGDSIYFPKGTFDLPNGIEWKGDRTYAGTGSSTLKGRSADGQMISIHGGDNVAIRCLKLQGGGLFIDKGTGHNRNIVIDNDVFELSTSGANPSAITATSGLESSKITNNYFTGYGGGFGIYGYHYYGLVIANNEFVDIRAGMHIAAFGDSHDLLVEQNYMKGLKGMGLEFQGGAHGLTFQDNWYEHPNLSSTFKDNDGSFAFSLPLDASSKIVIRRNGVVAPERPDGKGCRIGFEVGGDEAMVEDNYVNGINAAVADNDGVGTSSVTVRNNKLMNYLEFVSIAFPSTSPSRVLFKENNGPDVVLTWDIDRPKPARNRRY